MTISDIEQRILDKLDSSDSKIDDLCERMVRMETTVSNHLEHQRQKFNRTTVIFGLLIGAVGIMVAVK